MKRYLTIGIVFGVLVIIIVTISWFAFPAWQTPGSGGFWTLLGVAAVGVVAFLQGAISIWKDLKEEKKENSKPPSQAPMQEIDSQNADSIYNAPGGTINVYPPAVEAEQPVPEIPSFWHIPYPYPMPPNFTGRSAELEMLDTWLTDNQNRLFILCATGGFSKSALAWQWINTRVNPDEYPKLVWWSFYEGDASFENFIKETLEYLNVEVPPGQRQQVDALLKAMRTQNILLIMDGFERALRAYSSMNAAYQGDDESLTSLTPQPPSSPAGEEGGAAPHAAGDGEVQTNQRDCVNLNAEIFLKNLCVLLNIKGKVLMTTRLTPRAVEQRGELLDGCHEIELKAMQKGDAVAFFRAQGIRGVRAEIEVACEPYGYHPLSLRILAGLIANDRETPGDIAVAGKLDITDDIIANKSHVLKVAYDTLSSEQQKLLSHIACFRFAMSYDALKAISDKDIKDYLAILEHRGLLHWDKTANKYDLHPIVRRYAYERLTVPDRTAAHNRLRDYFEAVPKPQKVERLEDLTPVIELYHHTVRSKEYHAAWTLYDSRLRVPLYYRFGKYQEDIELLQALSDAEVLPNVGSRRDQTWILLYLSMDHERIGQLLKALTLNDQALALNRDKISLEDWGSCLVERASVSRYLGLLKDAESNIAESTMLFDSLQSANWIGISHRNYGNVLIVCGRLVEAKSQLDIAEQIYRVSENRFLHGLSRTFIYRSILLEQSGDSRSAVNYAQKARSYAIRGNYLREMVMANCRLGRMYLESGSLTDADTKFREALLECRKMNLLDLEPEVLLGLASVRFELAEYSEAMKLAEEALLITERCGYVLQGADVHLFLAELALEGVKLQVESEMSDKEAARLHAEKALELATCDGPPYYYKVAYEEAERFLEKL